MNHNLDSLFHSCQEYLMYYFICGHRQSSFRISFLPLEKALKEFCPGQGLVSDDEWNSCFFSNIGSALLGPQLVARARRNNIYGESFWDLTKRGKEILLSEKSYRLHSLRKIVDSCSISEIKELMVFLDEKMES